VFYKSTYKGFVWYGPFVLYLTAHGAAPRALGLSQDTPVRGGQNRTHVSFKYLRQLCGSPTTKGPLVIGLDVQPNHVSFLNIAHNALALTRRKAASPIGGRAAVGVETS